MENLSYGALLFQISENLLEFRPFKTSRKLPYFEKNQLCACLIYACTYSTDLGKVNNPVSHPAGRESRPAGRECRPVGRESLPAGRESLPAGRESLPAGRESLPAGRVIRLSERIIRARAIR